MIKIFPLAGGERLRHHPAKENPLKNKVEKRYHLLLGRWENREKRRQTKMREATGKRKGQNRGNAGEKLEARESRTRNPTSSR